MLGFRLFMHSLELVFRNFDAALKIGLVPVVLFHLISMMMMRLAGLELTAYFGTHDIVQIFMQGGVYYAKLLVIFLWLFFSCWVFVLWHRFVLLDEVPVAWVLKLHLSRLKDYALRAVQIFLITMLLMIPIIMVVTALIASNEILPEFGLVFEAATFVMTILLVIPITRFSLVLPAAAIHNSFDLGAAWQATKDNFWSLAVLVSCSTVLGYAVGFVSEILTAWSQSLGIIVGTGLSLVATLINVSVLTTLYGYFVEKREL